MSAAELERPFSLLPLFGEAGAALEARLDDIVARALEGFHAAAQTTSELPFSELAPRFAATSIPDEPRPAVAYLEELAGELVPHAYNTVSPRFVGHMTTSLPAFVRPLSRLIVGLHQNPVKVETAKAATALERQVLAQLHREVFGGAEAGAAALGDAFYAAHAHDRESTLGIATSGGTIANLTALWIARNRSLGASVEHEGLAAALAQRGQRRAVVIGSALMHYSFDKAADLLGFGRANLRRVAVDAQGSVRPEAVARALREAREREEHVLAVVGVAGTTDCGSFDPLEELAELASAAGVHFHVDAAWGGPLLFSEAHRGRLRGIARADSVTIDGHKQLYLPMGSGFLLLRDPKAAGAIEKQAAYIIRAASPDLGRRSLEGSRPASSALLHAGLQLLGRRGYAALIDRGIALARAFAEEIAATPGLELLAAPQSNIVNYRLRPAGLAVDADAVDALNIRVQEAQRDAGRGFVSRTTLSHLGPRPLVALRAVLANPRTTLSDLRAVLAEQRALAGLL